MDELNNALRIIEKATQKLCDLDYTILERQMAQAISDDARFGILDPNHRRQAKLLEQARRYVTTIRTQKLV